MKLPLFILLFIATFAQVGVGAEPIEMGSRGVSSFVARLEKDRKAHVAFLGGSITEKATGHSKMIAEWLKERFPSVNFTFTNAGLSSTCSVAGAFRFAEDVLAKGRVDLLIVEFAANDDHDADHDRQTSVRGLEGILRQYFLANPAGSAISVQYVTPEILEDRLQGGTTDCVEAHKAVARHYDVPIVDIGMAVAEEIAAGRMDWDVDYGGTHPNEKGYGFASERITRVIEESLSREVVSGFDLPEPLDGKSFFEVERISPDAVDWLGGWKFGPVSEALLPMGEIRDAYRGCLALRSDSEGDYLYVRFRGTTLAAFILAGPDAGAVEVSVDAGAWQRVEFYQRYSDRLNYPKSVILADGLSEAKHQVAIRTVGAENPDSQGEAATILYFSVNR